MRFKYLILLILLSNLCGIVSAQIPRSNDFHNRYKLSEVVVMSRHNIRSPLAGRGSVLDRITPHNWHTWSSSSSRLTLKGAVMETRMGQYFHGWLVNDGLFSEDEIPQADEVRIYANSMQRTIATARYFMSGMLPLSSVPVEHHCSVGTMDSIFTPQITWINDDFCQTAFQQIAEKNGETATVHKLSPETYYCVLNNTPKKLTNSYSSMRSVLDIQQSPACVQGDTCDFSGPDTIWLRLNDEPRTTGALKMAYSASDALILQYYEEPDDNKAAFGHHLNYSDWVLISEIKDWYGDLLFTSPVVAKQTAAPLLNEIARELNTPHRKFTFLCGHDSNIGSILTVLGISNYELPETIEKKTPIGMKVVFEKWVDNIGEYYIAVNLVYHSTQQIRQGQYSEEDNVPVIFPLHFNWISANSDGLYPFDRFIQFVTR